MPAIKPILPWLLRSEWRTSAAPFHRFAAVALMLVVCSVGASDPADAQSQAIDLSRQPLGAPPQDFEFWRAGEADPDHWALMRDAATDSNVSSIA